MRQLEVISTPGGDDRGAHRLLCFKQRVKLLWRILPVACVNLLLKLIQLEVSVPWEPRIHGVVKAQVVGVGARRVGPKDLDLRAGLLNQADMRVYQLPHGAYIYAQLEVAVHFLVEC